MTFDEIKQCMLDMEGILAVHNIRVWMLTSSKIAFAAHLAIEPGSNAQQILHSASDTLRNRFNFYEMTLQVEDYQREMSDCKQCVNPKS